MSYVIEPFIRLGEEIRREGIPADVVEAAVRENGWFTSSSIGQAAEAIRTEMLDATKLERWLKGYPYRPLDGQRVGIVMAGNIPFVGFSDLMTTILSGSDAFVKLSGKDRVLMGWMIDRLRSYGVGNISFFAPGDHTPLDKVIATGSDNSNRYFRLAFEGIPSVFRGARTSCAILSGEESDRELSALHEDCFSYFGLGCRNVSHLFVPEGYDFSRLRELWQKRPVEHSSFSNRYRQNRALTMMRDEEFIDGGYYLIREDHSLFSPLTEIHFTRYNNRPLLDDYIAEISDQLQCVVGRDIPFGGAQSPALSDWADHVDLLTFLQSK